MKKILAVILCLTFVLAAFGPMAVLADDAAEETTPVEGFVQDDEKKEFRASTADALMEVARVINANGAAYSEYNIFIDADIDMAGKTWKPIAAAQKNNYRGTIDGQGHTIAGLSVQDYSNSVGFVGYAGSGVVIKDLHLVGVSFHSVKAYNGALIGRLENIVEVPTDAEALIVGCTVQGSIATDSNYAGGLVGAIHNGLAITTTVEDEEGNPVEKDVYIPANLRVENCAVNMTLSTQVNYAAGIIAGDSFQKDGDSLDGAIPHITCKDVFVTGTYKAPAGAQASGFIGYCNLAILTLENCFSAAKVEGSKDVSGSFFSRTRKSVITVRECYSMSEMPFSGEIDNVAGLKDDEGNVLDAMNIVNSYAMALEILDETGAGTGTYADAMVCTKLTTLAKPAEPAAEATAEEIKAYEEALALYNSLILITLNAQNYGIDQVADPEQATSTDGKTAVNKAITLTVPAKPLQELLILAEEIVNDTFAEGSKQLELFNAYMKTVKCEHTNTRELVSSEYIAANATCTVKAKYYKSCADCYMALEETFETGEFAPHTWANRWGGDDENHYHACTVCKQATTDVAAHTFGEWEVEKEPTTTKEGKKVRKCTVCEAEQKESIPKLEPTPEENTGNENNNDAGKTEEKKEGCGSAIGGASIIIMLAAAGAVVLRKKED